MFVYNTIKGELCLVECWMDEDYSERYEDGGRDLIWIDRHHTNEFGDIENYMSQKFADISDTIWIEVHALRSTEVTRYEQKDDCLLYTSPSPRDYAASRMPSSA